MAGFGTMSFGLTPFGLGSPQAPGEAPTGGGGVRFINPVTRDYEIDAATGQYAQMPSVRQRVMLSVGTELNSSGVEGFGALLPRKIGADFDAQARSTVVSALRQLIEVEKAIRLDSVTTERGTLGRARINISFTDLVTGESHSLTV